MIDQTAREIREMRTHSSSTVAINAARALRELRDRDYQSVEDVLRSVERNSKVLRQANPSHASLQSTQRSIVEAVSSRELDSTDDALAALEAAIADTIEDIERAKDAAADAAMELIADGDVLLTHDFSTTVLAVAERVADRGDSLDVFTTEARPRFMGRRMARELSAVDGIDVTLIVDSAAGYALDSCDRVVVGMSCIVDDLLYNRVGTFPIAACAAQLDVPVSVVGASAKVIEDGFVFENDHREAVEVMREPTTAFGIANPAYDATPVDLIETIVTDEGIESP